LKAQSLTRLDPQPLVRYDRLVETSRDSFMHSLDLGSVLRVEVPFI
jgi:hypothetical protein